VQDKKYAVVTKELVNWRGRKRKENQKVGGRQSLYALDQSLSHHWNHINQILLISLDHDWKNWSSEEEGTCKRYHCQRSAVVQRSQSRNITHVLKYHYQRSAVVQRSQSRNITHVLKYHCQRSAVVQRSQSRNIAHLRKSTTALTGTI
jgi:hypothetical protein